MRSVVSRRNGQGVEKEGSAVQLFEDPSVKHGFATRAVPLEEICAVAPASRAPRIGDVVLAEVVKVGRNKTIETRDGVAMHLFPGDRIVGAFGNRYATDQFEGYVPDEPVEDCDMFSMGGVCGRVASKHASMSDPTRLRILGQVHDGDGRPLNTRSFGLPLSIDSANGTRSGAEVILVVGSTMNSGKTTTAGTIARALDRQGHRVAAAKVTGTASGKDGRFFEASGARPVVDFTSAGYPSTYMLGREELLGLYHGVLAHLRSADPDYIVIEIADGIFQRETRMMLESEAIRSSVDHVFFAAGDSLSIDCGVRVLRDYDLPLRATAGAITQSALAAWEAEEASGMACLSVDRMMNGELVEALQVEREEEPEELPDAGRGLVASAAGAVTSAADAVAEAVAPPPLAAASVERSA